MTDSSAAPLKERPLSPHLEIYKPIPTMVMSILHRFTGCALYGGTVLIAWWVLAAASGPEAYETVNWWFTSILGKLALFGYTLVLIHHMLGGIKHLVQDTGRGLEKDFTTMIAKAHPIASIVLAVVIWIFGAIIF